MEEFIVNFIEVDVIINKEKLFHEKENYIKKMLINTEEILYVYPNDGDNTTTICLKDTITKYDINQCYNEILNKLKNAGVFVS